MDKQLLPQWYSEQLAGLKKTLKKKRSLLRIKETWTITLTILIGWFEGRIEREMIFITDWRNLNSFFENAKGCFVKENIFNTEWENQDSYFDSVKWAIGVERKSTFITD